MSFIYDTVIIFIVTSNNKSILRKLVLRKISVFLNFFFVQTLNLTIFQFCQKFFTFDQIFPKMPTRFTFLRENMLK